MFHWFLFFLFCLDSFKQVLENLRYNVDATVKCNPEDLWLIWSLQHFAAVHDDTWCEKRHGSSLYTISRLIFSSFHMVLKLWIFIVIIPVFERVETPTFTFGTFTVALRSSWQLTCAAWTGACQEICQRRMPLSSMEMAVVETKTKRGFGYWLAKWCSETTFVVKLDFWRIFVL